jgi:hypothetical protein
VSRFILVLSMCAPIINVRERAGAFAARFQLGAPPDNNVSYS